MNGEYTSFPYDIWQKLKIKVWLKLHNSWTTLKMCIYVLKKRLFSQNHNDTRISGCSWARYDLRNPISDIVDFDRWYRSRTDPYQWWKVICRTCYCKEIDKDHSIAWKKTYFRDGRENG